MAHKHELQSLLFRDKESSLAADIAADITSLIIVLEDGASKLQNFTVCLLSRYNNCLHYIIISFVLQLQYCKKLCVEFTADQYHDIFKSRFQNQGNILASLDICLNNWMNTTNNCKTWNQYKLKLNE